MFLSVYGMDLGHYALRVVRRGVFCYVISLLFFFILLIFINNFCPSSAFHFLPIPFLWACITHMLLITIYKAAPLTLAPFLLSFRQPSISFLYFSPYNYHINIHGIRIILPLAWFFLHFYGSIFDKGVYLSV